MNILVAGERRIANAQDWSDGDQAVLGELMPLVYDELRYFSGLDIDETAEALRISNATVRRDRNMAKAWLKQEIEK